MANIFPDEVHVAAPVSMHKTDFTGVLKPHRDDVVATWLKARRDELPIGEGANAIDWLLDEYRLRADAGLSLTDEIPEGAS